VYEKIGRLLNAPPSDVGLFDSATRAWCSVVNHLEFRPTDRLWTTPYEYAGNLISLVKLRERYGATIEVIPLRPNGQLDLDWIAANIEDDVALVSVTHVPSGCGVISPVEEVGSIVGGRRCIYAVDACQSAGQLGLDTQAMRVDLLTAAGRKFLRGPRGTGFAYTSPRLRRQLQLPFVDLHAASIDGEQRFSVTDETAATLELSERSNAAIVGFDAALDVHLSADRSGQAETFAAACEVIASVSGVRVIAPRTKLAGIVSFVHETVPAAQIHRGLAERAVNTWPIVGWHTPIYMRSQGVTEAVRVSVHYYNSLNDVDSLALALHEVVRG
ncbi:MAG: aminotransferase class V-fold PLP-dependent enzyme, partial [Pseudonocardiaceae bacterium]